MGSTVWALNPRHTTFYQYSLTLVHFYSSVLYFNDTQLSPLLNGHLSNPVGSFTAICRILRETYTKTSNLGETAAQKALYLMTFSPHQTTYSVIVSDNQTAVLKGSRELETLLLTLKNVWAVRQNIYIEVCWNADSGVPLFTLDEQGCLVIKLILFSALLFSPFECHCPILGVVVWMEWNHNTCW